MNRTEEENDVSGEEPKSPSYWTLPRRDQILVLVICRFCEPLAYNSISPYIYYMVRDFGFTEPSEISELVTILMTLFSLGQALTGVWWGTFSDSMGRKPAILLGSLGTGLSLIIFGTAQNIYVAMLGRLLAGALNGNVGVMRTMVAEFVGDRKEYQSRAFAILPITMNVGTVVGPMIGGLLADPAENYPGLFGENAFLKKYPYILPNMFPLPFILVSLICNWLFLEETLRSPTAIMLRSQDSGLRFGNRLKTWWTPDQGSSIEEEALLAEEYDTENVLLQNVGDGGIPSVMSPKKITYKNTTAKFRAVLTRPILVTLSTYILLMFHAPAFNQLFPLFLSTPRINVEQRTWYYFNGGLALPTSEIGVVLSVLGVLAVIMQLMIYPAAAAYLGNARLHRAALLVFPFVYFAIPYLSFLPEDQHFLTLLATIAAALVAVLGRTFGIPPMAILINNACPSKKVLGTVNGLTHSVTSMARTLGPFILGNAYSLGLKFNMIFFAWWIMAVIVCVQIVVASRLKEWGEEELIEELEDETEVEQERRHAR